MGRKDEKGEAVTAAAQFRRITPEEEITVPCVMARLIVRDGGKAWDASLMLYSSPTVDFYRRAFFTHWLPIQFPEVRG